MRNAGVHFRATFRRVVTSPLLLFSWFVLLVGIWCTVEMIQRVGSWLALIALMYLTIFAVPISLVARGNMPLPLRALPVAPRPRALAETAATLLVPLLLLSVLPLLPLPLHAAGSLAAATVRTLAFIWMLFPFVASVCFVAGGEGHMFIPTWILAAVLGVMSILGVSWSSHPFVTGTTLLAIVTTIGPRWNDLVTAPTWRYLTAPQGAMWQPALPLAQAMRRQALRGARASVLTGLLMMVVFMMLPMAITLLYPDRDSGPLDVSMGVAMFPLALLMFPLGVTTTRPAWKSLSAFETLLITPDRVARATLFQVGLHFAVLALVLEALKLGAGAFGMPQVKAQVDRALPLAGALGFFWGGLTTSGFPRTWMSWAIFTVLVPAFLLFAHYGATLPVLLLVLLASLMMLPILLPRRWAWTRRFADRAPWPGARVVRSR